VVTGTPSPGAPAGSTPAPNSSDGGDVLHSADRAGGIPAWPWTAVLFVVILIAGVWRFRSWLIGLLENVVVMGRSGADLETELLHHETSPPPSDPEASSVPEDY
jgi:hypothetical protein